jgi:alginate O-acetyltransferase complex protein AlgI
MLFNSYTFILLFLPATVLGYWRIGQGGSPGGAATWGCGALCALLLALMGGDPGQPAAVALRLAVTFPMVMAALLLLPRLLGAVRAGIAWLVLVSLVFYGWWSLEDLGLILVLTLFNFAMGRWQSRHWERHGRGHKAGLIAGLGLDLAVLGYFKYTDLALLTINVLAGSEIPLQHIILPLGISFYTFQKIAFLVDSYHGQTRGFGFLDYCLFVMFFPQLIAGPIVHHRDVIKQFAALSGRLKGEDLAVGTTLFVFGLFKKVVIADAIAPTVDAIYGAAEGRPLTGGEAWVGVLAYAGQLYFDFSGYSDMAIGLARMFSIRLPMNFNSPYQARDVVEFWSRWHMTLSRFLRDYLYFPLVGRSRAFARHQAAVFTTMLLGGLWHGAGWTFVAWGALHGLYLVINHQWRAQRKRWGWTSPGRTAALLGWAITFLAVVTSFTFFRATSMQAALSMLQSMFGLSAAVPNGGRALFTGNDLAIIAGVLLMAFTMPNVQRLMCHAQPVLDHTLVKPCRVAWSRSVAWGLVTGVLALVALQSLTRPSAFLYFQF